MRKLIYLCLAVLLFISFFVGCQTATTDKSQITDDTTIPETSLYIESNSESPLDESQVIPEIPEHQTLTIMCNNRTEWLVKSLSNCFSKRNPDVDINIIKIDNNKVKDYTDKLNEMLEKEEGPDIFLLCDEVVYKTNQYIYSDIFADIDALNEIYGYLDFNDYNETIMNYGIHNGIRKVFPIFYSIPTLIGIEELLTKENIKYGDGVTLKEFANSLSKSELADFSNSIWFDTFYRYSGLNLILDSTETYDLDNPKFKTLVESYEVIFPLSAKSPPSVSSKNYENKECGALMAEQVTFQNFSRFSQWESTLLGNQSEIQAIIDTGKTPIITHIPSFDGEGIPAVVDFSLAINAKTQYSEAALRFLQYAASFEYMLDDTVYWSLKPISVNKQYIEAEKNAYYGFSVDLPTDYPINYFYKRFAPLPIEIIDSYYTMLDNIFVPKYASTGALTHMIDFMIYYEKLNCDYSTALPNAKERLDYYWSQ